MEGPRNCVSWADIVIIDDKTLLEVLHNKIGFFSCWPAKKVSRVKTELKYLRLGKHKSVNQKAHWSNICSLAVSENFDLWSVYVSHKNKQLCAIAGSVA